ncbi:hypothetical protein ABPG74_003964 [Tetrahymena malaccensis]
MLVEQVKVVLKKNFLLSIRSKEILADVFFPLVVGLVVSYVTNELNKVILGIPFTSFTRSIVYQFVHDKAERMKEIQKIMGLRTTSYNVSWLVYYYLRGFVACLFFLIPAAANGVLTVEGFDWVSASIMYISNMYMNIHFAFFISSFFSRPRLAAELYMLLSVIMTLFFYAAFDENIGQDNSLMLLLAFIFPQSAMMWAWLSNGWQQSTQILYFTFEEGMLVINIMSVFYLISFLYFDQIIQTEFGTSKSPFFFITELFQKSGAQGKIYSLFEKELESQDLSQAHHKEEVDITKYKSSVQIKELNKKYGSFQAVKDLNLTLFEKQIFCLLGHNGAGKTTTISLLTGLIKKTSGRVKIYDKDQDEDFEQIRSYIGLCTQRDALYDQLTIEEHLAYIGELKGKYGEELKKDIENVIIKCALDLQRGKQAQNLSGGNKRKLSMAMALIGGSKVIFLDEPTSGLDSLSRIQIRGIINDMRDSERTIVLTTHHLEEVEELADRTAIMAKGQLLAVGSNHFIKHKFGIGYHLTLSKKSQVQMNEEQAQQIELNLGDKEGFEKYEASKFLNAERCEQLKQVVFSLIPNAKYNPQSAKGTVAMTLPFDNKDKFVQLFQILEKDFEDVQIMFEMNTLEDAFINIGMDEQKYLNVDNKASKEQEKFTDFNNIQAPECLNRAPRFLFFNQLWALFLRRMYVSFRSVAMIFTFLFPLLTQIGGVILTKQAFKDFDGSDENRDFGQLSLNAAFQLLSYCLTMTGIAASPVIDNESKLRYALTVMGCRNITYWLGAFIFDSLIMLFMFAVFYFMVPFFNIPGVENNLTGISQVIIISIFCFIGFSYLCSFIYSRSRWVYLTYPWLIFFVFFAGFQALFLYEKTTSPFLRWVYCLISPFLNMSNGMIVLALETYFGSNTGSYQPFWVAMFPDEFADHTLYMKILIGQAFLYITLAISVDYLIQQMPNKSIRKEDYSQLEREQVIANQEIVEEDQRVANPFCQDKIKVSKLYKTYYPGGKPFTAIQNNSFGVHNGEVMGLLGPNGAGKSTTFNIITSLLQKSSGSVQLKGVEVKSGVMDVYQDVGICPQFDSVYENLSVEDHLNLFGRMKGLYGKNLTDSVNYFIKIMQLEDYRKRAAGKLSGGNKRKLCVTIALIGGPDMQFFDEPSSGVDPIARRFLWNTLKMSLQKRNSAIVLTTHSMHEAETLCTKIGILVNGKFQCMGSPDFLKKKYGDGYRLIIKLKDEANANYVHEQISQNLPQAQKIVNFDGQSVTYQLQYENFSFYTVYSLLDKLSNIPSKAVVSDKSQLHQSMRQSARNNNNSINMNQDIEQQLDVLVHRNSIERSNKFVVDSFQITESTLEQIFIQFSQHQAVRDEETENKIKRRKFLCF